MYNSLERDDCLKIDNSHSGVCSKMKMHSVTTKVIAYIMIPSLLSFPGKQINQAGIDQVTKGFFNQTKINHVLRFYRS